VGAPRFISKVCVDACYIKAPVFNARCTLHEQNPSLPVQYISSSKHTEGEGTDKIESKAMDAKRLFHKLKPFLAVVFLQFGFAGMDILCKAALNKGMSNYVLVVYRHAVATIVIAPFAVIMDRYLSRSLSLHHII